MATNDLWPKQIQALCWRKRSAIMQYNTDRFFFYFIEIWWSERCACKVRNPWRALNVTWIPLLLACIILYWCRRYDQTQCESASNVSAHTAAMQPSSPKVLFRELSHQFEKRCIDLMLCWMSLSWEAASLITIFGVGFLNLVCIMTCQN